MPRGVGTGNADIVQQRARFFGYKRRYLGFCRVYLEQGTLAAFESYVMHEEDIRSQLKVFHESGQPLNEWKRAFLLDTSLRPCRNSVLGFDYMQGRFSNDWVAPRVVLASPDVLEANRRVVATFVQSDLVWTEDEGHPDRTDTQRHLVCDGLRLQQVISDLLVRMRITGMTDSQRNTGLLLQLKKVLEDDPNETCRVYRMSGGRIRQRGVDDTGDVTNLYQGENPVVPRNLRGSIYPGDRAIRDNDNVTVQIHTLQLTQNDTPVADNVVVLTVWVPRRIAEGWLAQELQVQP